MFHNISVVNVLSTLWREVAGESVPFKNDISVVVMTF